ncbi:MAG TPA: hypothetical protein VE309_13400 [Caulobacteraceae bacterium]|jgi:hypothetical protein|nr:hypothetical protein [Caulobacteraceae bacterium]
MASVTRRGAEGDHTSARKSARGGRRPKDGGAHPDHVRDERIAHTEDNLDKGLEETFPASDPVSISPGAD